MSFLTVAGTAVRVASFRELAPERAGGLRRTINGELRGDVLWSRRHWSGAIYAESAAHADAIRALAPYGVAVSISGDALRGQVVRATVEFTGSDFSAIGDGSDWYEMIAFDMREA